MTENDYFPTFDHCSDRLILPKVTEHDDVPTLVPYLHRLKTGALRRSLADPSALATREGKLGEREREIADLKKACGLFQVRSSIFPGRPGVRMWRRLRQMDAVGRMGGLRGVSKTKI